MKGVSASQPGFAFPFFQVSELFFCFGAFNFVLLRFLLPNGKTVTLKKKKKKCHNFENGLTRKIILLALVSISWSLRLGKFTKSTLLTEEVNHFLKS